MEARRGYRAYLLRLSQVCSKDQTTWRAALESAQTGERIGFASLGGLFAFLDNEVCQASQDEAAPGADEKA